MFNWHASHPSTTRLTSASIPGQKYFTLRLPCILETPRCARCSLSMSLFLIACGTTILVWSMSIIIDFPFSITDILSIPCPTYSLIAALDSVLYTSWPVFCFTVMATDMYPLSSLAASHMSSRAGSLITSVQMSPLIHEITLL